MPHLSLSFKTLSVAAILLVGAIAIRPCAIRRAAARLVNCTPLRAVCRPAGRQTNACRVAIVAAAARRQSASDGGRSSIHTDVSYLLAQSVGFSATDAYWIAAYDEAADLRAGESGH